MSHRIWSLGVQTHKENKCTDLIIYNHMYESIYIVQNSANPFLSIQAERERERVSAHPHTHALILFTHLHTGKSVGKHVDFICFFLLLGCAQFFRSL